MFRSLKSLFRFGDAKAEFYEGGKHTLANRDFYNASTDDFERLASADRDTMRARARWLHENNPIVANIDETIINNTVGTGIRFQSNTGMEKVDAELESLWREWCDRQNLDVTGRYDMHDFQRILLGQRMTDGEILVQKVISTNKFFPLSLQAIEVDNLEQSGFLPTVNGKIVDGIELNRFGKPVAYIFQDRHTNKKFSVKAKNIINFYRPENRFSQYRGISEYKQIILSLKNFAAFNDATIESARARANIGYVIERDYGLGKQGKNIVGTDKQIEEINGVFVEHLNGGEKLKVIDPTASGTGYKDFVDFTVRMIATGRKVSYELAFKDFTKTNFSSARASLIQDHKLFDSNQEHMANYFLNPIYETFVRTMVMAGNVRTINQSEFWKNPKRFIKPQWITPERIWIDPLKEIKAVAQEIELGITTLTEVAKSKGKDFETLVQQRLKENEMLRKAGLLSEEAALFKKESKK